MAQRATLDAVMQYVGERYVFTHEQYPSLQGRSPEERRAFAVSHSVYHILKSIGRLAGECEQHDHGRQLDDRVLKEGVVKIFINTLKLAEELGISAGELVDSVPSFMASK